MSVFENKDTTSLAETIPESLKYAGALKSSVVTNKSSIRVFPVGSQTVDSRSNKQVLFRIASSEYLMPATACLNFRVKAHHNNVRGQELVALALIDALTLSIGGVEVEYLQEAGLLAKEIISHSVVPDTYKNSLCGYLGGWKYKPRASAYVRTSTAGTDTYFTSDPAKNADITSGADTYKNAIEGRVWREDSFAISDSDDKLADGVEYSVPLHLLLGIFRLKNLLPVWAMGSIDIKIDFAKFSQCMLIAWSQNRSAAGVLTPELDGTDIARVPDAQKYYTLDNIYMLSLIHI